MAFAVSTDQRRDERFSSLLSQPEFGKAGIMSTFLGLPGSRDPRHITVQNEDDIGFKDFWVSCDSDTPVCLVVTADAHIGANHLHHSDGQLVT